MTGFERRDAERMADISNDWSIRPCETLEKFFQSYNTILQAFPSPPPDDAVLTKYKAKRNFHTKVRQIAQQTSMEHSEVLLVLDGHRGSKSIRSFAAISLKNLLGLMDKKPPQNVSTQRKKHETYHHPINFKLSRPQHYQL